MKLWILKPREELLNDDERETDNPWEPWFDKCFGIVVEAENEARAREVAADDTSKYGWGGQWGRKPYTESRYSTCEELLPTGAERVVIKDEHWA